MTQPVRYNLESLVKFRRHMHQHPEIGFQEIETQKNIKQYLLQLGVQEKAIKECSTGLIVDIPGLAAPTGKNKIIALRADIDALSMIENNPHLEYRSINNNAHMCGHDGHTTCLLGFTALYLDTLEKIPSNKIVRLLFQPCEEGPESGALELIKNGCLEGVDEVYGYHNWPTHKVGYLMVKPGPVMYEVTVIYLEIIGKGGHGSEPQKANDPIQAGIDFHLKFRKIQEKFEGRQYVCTLPVFQAGERFNVIPDRAKLQGTLRSLEDGLTQEFEKEIRNALEELKNEKGIDYNLVWKIYDPVVSNSKAEAHHVERVAKQFFGEENVGPGCMPVKASEDFAYYLLNKPGAFFFLGSGKKENDTMIHDCQYDFNENLIEPASQFWLKLTLDRLQI